MSRCFIQCTQKRPFTICSSLSQHDIFTGPYDKALWMSFCSAGRMSSDLEQKRHSATRLRLSAVLEGCPAIWSRRDILQHGYILLGLAAVKIVGSGSLGPNRVSQCFRCKSGRRAPCPTGTTAHNQQTASLRACACCSQIDGEDWFLRREDKYAMPAFPSANQKIATNWPLMYALRALS